MSMFLGLYGSWMRHFKALATHSGGLLRWPCLARPVFLACMQHLAVVFIHFDLSENVRRVCECGKCPEQAAH